MALTRARTAERRGHDPGAPSSGPPPPAARARLAALMPNRWSVAATPGTIFVILAFAVPMVMVLVQSFTNPSPHNYSIALGSGIFQRAIVATFVMALVVTAISLVIGYPYAYAMVRSGQAMRGFLLVMLMISFWTSLLVRTFAWEVLLQDTGVINTALINLHIIKQPLSMMHTTFSVYVGMVHILAPYLILALYAQMRTISPDLEMAARGLGAKQSTAFWRVTLPLSLPGAVGGSVLVFVLALGFYITPEMLGTGTGTYIGQAIVNQVEQLLQTGVGAAESVLLLAMVVIVLALAARFIGLGKILGIGRRSER